MELKNMTKEELETLSYADLAYLIIKENGKSMNTPSVFKKVCELLEYSEEEYSSKIGDFYTSLTTDKRFLLLDSAEWDLRDNHSVKVDVDDDEEDDVEIEEDEEEEIEEEMEEENNSNEEQEVVEDNSFDLNNYNEFISQKDGYYYIYLKKDEKIYYPK